MNDKSLTIAEMQAQAHSTSKSKGWHDDQEDAKLSFPTRLALIHSEVSEALEEFRNGYATNEVYYENETKPCGIPIELADILIRVADVCGKYEIDLEEAVRVKLAYNLTRPARHGGKVV